MGSLPESLMPASGRRAPREAARAQQHDELLAVAIEVFAKRGYPDTNVEHIVAGARVGVSSFYSLFASKESCFLEAYERIVADGRERIAVAVPADGEWPEQLRAALSALLEFVEAEPMQARVVFAEVQSAGAKALDRHEQNLDRVASLLRGGRDHSPFAAELPRTLEVAAAGGLFWFLQQQVVAGGPGDAGRLLPEMMEIVAEPYLGRDATRELLARLSGR